MQPHQGLFFEINEFFWEVLPTVKKRSKKTIGWILAGCLLAALIGYIIWGNVSLEVTQYSLSTNRLPQSFSGYRIAQISDLHNAQFGKDNKRLTAKLKEIRPDIIVLTGDLIDSRKTNCQVAINFAAQAVKIAPTYYVPGNHEARIGSISQFYTKLENVGVTLLLDSNILLKKDQEAIRLAGIVDPDYRTADPIEETRQAIEAQMTDASVYTVLLSHRPEQFHAFAACGVDLALVGHTHGGQFRLPFLGGLYAPGHGIFPEYDGGIYTKNQTNMIVSRGLGNSAFPFRLNNRPEIVVVTLNSEN